MNSSKRNKQKSMFRICDAVSCWGIMDSLEGYPFEVFRLWHPRNFKKGRNQGKWVRRCRKQRKWSSSNISVVVTGINFKFDFGILFIALRRVSFFFLQASTFCLDVNLQPLVLRWVSVSQPSTIISREYIGCQHIEIAPYVWICLI